LSESFVTTALLAQS